ncbi:MAG: ABC transporter permease [Deltaproteobacteria bacterium]|nr:ABC transporter permease [Deltaproteobacteria bacterium]MBI3390479.1 ABC transporter permease [Deltaproteobacteria bacterium]
MTTESRVRRSLRSIRAILRREFIDIRRDRRSLFLTFLYPISMLIMYGYGIRYDVDNVPLTILDRSETPESRDLSQQMLRSGYFQIVRYARSERDVERDLTTDAARAAVVIPRDFADHLRAGTPTAVQVLIDGSDSNTATIAQGYALAIINRYLATLTPAQVMNASTATATTLVAPIEVKSRVWYNPELKSVNFIVPGVIAVIMMIVGAILTALSIVKEKERGTIEQILVSPIRPLEMMIGKIIPYVFIALLDLVIIITAGYLLFEVPIKGSLFPLAVFAILYLISSLGVGVFVSTIADNMQNAMLAAIFLSLMPAVLLSGFVFPLENMPLPIRIFSYLFPGRYFVTAIRGIYLKGVGLGVLWPEAVSLMVFGVSIVWLSASRFRDTLE